MQQSPSWEAAQLVIKSKTFMEPKGSSSHSQGPTTILSQTISVYKLITPTLLRPISYYPAIYACIPQVVSSFQLLQTKLYMHFSSVPCLLHIPSITPSLICSLEKVLSPGMYLSNLYYSFLHFYTGLEKPKHFVLHDRKHSQSLICS